MAILIFIFTTLIICFVDLIMQQNKNIDDIPDKDLIFHDKYNLFGNNYQLIITKETLISFGLYLLIYCIAVEPLIYVFIYKSEYSLTGVHESLALKKLTGNKLSQKDYTITFFKFIGFQFIFSLFSLLFYGLFLFSIVMIRYVVEWRPPTQQMRDSASASAPPASAPPATLPQSA